MEVVVLRVADDNETADEVDKRYVTSSALILSSHSCPPLPERLPRIYVRIALAFLPFMYLCWYLWMRPLGCASGAGPRGSFS